MRSLLLGVLAAYVVAAIHAVLAFINKRRALQRVSEWAMVTGFVLHTAALIADWALYGHYPLFYLRETLSFLAWTLVASYGLVLYRYRARPLGSFTLPLVSVLILHGHHYAIATQRLHRGSYHVDLMAVSGSHYAAIVCLRRIFCGFRGQHHVPLTRTRAQTKNIQRDLSSSSFTDYCQ